MSYKNFERSQRIVPLSRKVKDAVGAFLVAGIILWIFFALFVTGCVFDNKPREFKCVDNKVYTKNNNIWVRYYSQECVDR